MTISRRGFLQAAGISLVAAQLGTLPLPVFATVGTPIQGRVLEPVSVGGRALWPDSVVTILEADASHYRLTQGRVPRWAIQPMLADVPRVSDTPLNIPALVEVRGPVGIVRRNATATSRLVGRIGHGGVMKVVDVLPDEAGQPEWLLVGDDLGDKPGWTPAGQWAYIQPEPTAATVDTVRLDVGRQWLSAHAGGVEVFAAPVSTSHATPLPAGRWALSAQGPYTAWHDETTLRGVPWVLAGSGGIMLCGAYWHNRFGTSQPGPAVQMPPAAARWLYTALASSAALTIV